MDDRAGKRRSGRIGHLLLYWVFALPGALAAATMPDAGGPSSAQFAPSEVILQFDQTARGASRRQTLAAHGLTAVKTLRGLGGTRFVLARFAAPRHVPDVAREMAASPAVITAEPNYLRHASLVPNDPDYADLQWNLPMVQAETAWDVTDGSGVMVSVIDSGVAYEDYGNFRQAPDLAGTRFAPGYDFVNGDAHPNDDHGHGTHVVGTIAQATDNGKGLAGLAYGATIQPVKILDHTGTGTVADLAEAIRWAVDHGADVINLSLGSENGSSVELDAVRYALRHGVVVAAASGNSGADTVGYPAAYSEVIAVGAVNSAEAVTGYSNQGDALDLVAPGGDAVDRVGDPNPDYVYQQTFTSCNPALSPCDGFFSLGYKGTSMATPHVAAAAAQLISAGVTCTPAGLRSALEGSAKDLGTAGWDTASGHGLLQVADALAWAGNGGCGFQLGTAAGVGDIWTTVSVEGTGYSNPVVIAGPPTHHGSHPGVVRLRDVGATGFEMRFQEWDYRLRDLNDANHIGEDVPYLMLEAGRQVMHDGSVWEAGTFQLDGTGSWARVGFQLPFADTPRLFLTVQSANDGDAVTVRAREVGASGFSAALFEEEALMDGHAAETVGYLAVYSDVGSGIAQRSAGEEAPYLLQSVEVGGSWQPVWSSRLRLEEEASLDDEIHHVDERIDVLVLGNQLFAQDVTTNGGNPAALRQWLPEHPASVEWGVVGEIDGRWTRVPLARPGYADPVVVAGPVSSNGPHPGVLRMQGVDSKGFQLRYQEWDYLDGEHAPEQVFYLVADAGVHDLAGLAVEAGHVYSDAVARNGTWAPVPFTAFLDPPAVFGSVTTHNGRQAVTLRMRDRTAGGIELAMDEQESRTGGHTEETLGWIAVETGDVVTPSGRRIQVFDATLSDTPSPIIYPRPVNGRFPTVVGGVTTTNGSNPFFIRRDGASTRAIDLYLHEDQSADAETRHMAEEASVFAAE